MAEYRVDGTTYGCHSFMIGLNYHDAQIYGFPTIQDAKAFAYAEFQFGLDHHENREKLAQFACSGDETRYLYLKNEAFNYLKIVPIFHTRDLPQAEYDGLLNL